MRNIYNNNRRRAGGFTIIELIIVVTIAAILTPLVIVSLGNLYQANVATLGKIDQSADTYSVLRSIAKDLAINRGWETSLPVSLPLGPTNSTVTPETWSYCGTGGTTNCTSNVNRVLIAYTNATDKASSDSTRLPVLAMVAGNCNTAGTIDTIKVARIYFVAPDRTDATKNDLYRRTVVNPAGATPCSGVVPYQTNTCAASVSNNAGCMTNGVSHTDAVLLTDIQSFNVDYYSLASDSSPIANPYQASASAITGSQAIRITATTQRLINGVMTSKASDILIPKQ